MTDNQPKEKTTKMTNEQVNELEKALREAQAKIEEAARIVCSSTEETAIDTWHACDRISREISSIFYPLYKLRP